MSGTIRNVYFIMEEIEIFDIFQRFSVFLKLEHYEMLKMGDFLKNELPNGLKFPVLLESTWFEKPEFEVEIRTNGHIYAGILDINGAEPGDKGAEPNQNLSISGTAKVYNINDPTDHITLKCTILIEDPVAERAEKPEVVAPTRDEQTQTEREKLRKVVEKGVQTDDVTTSTVSTTTTEPYLDIEQLQPILLTSISHHLKQHRPHKSLSPPPPQKISTEIPAKPAQKSIKSLNSFNLMPRIGKLQQLDAQIAEKQKFLEALNSEIELKKKMVKFLERRMEIGEKIDKVDKIDEKPSEKGEISSESTSSDSESESESSTDSETTTTTTTTTTENSSETVRKIDTPPEAENKEESIIEHPFSAREPPESPTTAYMNNLRQKMLDQYQQKYT
ncbi:Transcription initiation factor TFIID subunit 7 [Caenorhabditis elegans]|uniref:Transcription initiation factor TFIID subunit 7 n=1 Tax=Caenorhabditis elegans TaxID=6239 RepID=Q965P9_CAEEL|nr:Transcription initiation factor TFIID subunit 7 [Caenorhabditis elegans]CCD73745.2 Transcription initiation factor TFIID subunit 7 [Caenorhabditis elegans]